MLVVFPGGPAPARPRPPPPPPPPPRPHFALAAASVAPPITIQGVVRGFGGFQSFVTFVIMRWRSSSGMTSSPNTPGGLPPPSTSSSPDVAWASASVPKTPALTALIRASPLCTGYRQIPPFASHRTSAEGDCHVGPHFADIAPATLEFVLDGSRIQDRSLPARSTDRVAALAARQIDLRTDPAQTRCTGSAAAQRKYSATFRTVSFASAREGPCSAATTVPRATPRAARRRCRSSVIAT